MILARPGTFIRRGMLPDQINFRGSLSEPQPEGYTVFTHLGVEKLDDLDSYRVPSEEYWPYEAEKAYKQALIDQINSDRLTAAERDEKLKSVPAMVRAKRSEMDKRARERQLALDTKFWSDAREELGYPSYLTARGVEFLEAKAYEDGHAFGYSDVFGKLVDLDEFLRGVMDHFVTPIPPISDEV